ncbi:MAG: transposase [Cyanobacteria bacterium SID2]|nr:transposase [Cyanobacteria bacterium SID2]
MNPLKYTAIDYINFLIGTQQAYSCSEAERVQPVSENAPSHDAITRMLHRLEPSPEDLWQEAQAKVQRKRGLLALDDTMLDKLYAQYIELVARQWSGKHKRVVKGINLTSLLWSDGDKHIRSDYRLYEKAVEGATKNDHFRAMLTTAREREFQPECVIFDSWYSSLANLKLIAQYGWTWLTRLKRNRSVNPDGTGNRAISEVELSETGTVVHLKGYGFIQVFKIVAPDGDIEYWATNDLKMSPLKRLQWAEWGWSIEEYHRGLKPCCGVAKAQVRSSRAQRNHMGLAIRAFLRLEMYWFNTGISWYESKRRVIREAVRSYLLAPWVTLSPTA